MIGNSFTPVYSQSQSGQHGAGQGTSTDVTFRYYDIVGSTEDELLDEMVSKGPQQENRRFFALTESQTSLTYETNLSDEGCRLTEIGVLMDIVVTLPTWIQTDADSDLVARWNVFEVALQNHEMWHVASAKASSRQISQALSTILEPDCLLASNKARQVSQQIIDEITLKNNEYDQATGHGRSQGASWPL